MILSDDEIQERIESPLNLLNRLRSSLHKTTTQNGSIIHPAIPAIPPKAEDLIPDLEDKVSNSSARSKATSIMIAAMNELQGRISEVKPEKLADIASQMSKVISNQDSKPSNLHTLSQIIVYAPQVQSLDNFDIIDVTE